MKGPYEKDVLGHVFSEFRNGFEGEESYSAKEPTATGSIAPFFHEKISLVAA